MTAGGAVAERQDESTREPERAEEAPAREWPKVLANPKRYRRA